MSLQAASFSQRVTAAEAAVVTHQTAVTTAGAAAREAERKRQTLDKKLVCNGPCGANHVTWVSRCRVWVSRGTSQLQGMNGLLRLGQVGREVRAGSRHGQMWCSFIMHEVCLDWG